MDWMILELFSNFGDSVITGEETSCQEMYLQESRFLDVIWTMNGISFGRTRYFGWDMKLEKWNGRSECVSTKLVEVWDSSAGGGGWAVRSAGMAVRNPPLDTDKRHLQAEEMQRLLQNGWWDLWA